LGLCFCEQIGRSTTERGSQTDDVSKRNISLAALDAADVGAMEARRVGERFLRKASRLPSSTDGSTEAKLNVLSHSEKGIRCTRWIDRL
jgi:hypothetical protein